MSCHVRARLAGAALMVAVACPAQAGPLILDVPTAVARARERAPEAIAALGRVDEARARRSGAGALVTQDPELQLGGGQRRGDPRSYAVQAQLTQQLEPARRGARIAVADAGVAHAQASRDDELRRLDFAVATAFHEARFGELAVELAQRSVEVATRAADAAGRRRRAGELTDLDVQLARLALGRARSALAAAQADRAGAVGRLAALVGAAPDDAIALTGELRPAPLALEPLRAAIAARADVRASEAEARVARAVGALARATGRPELGLWLGYQRDEGDTIVIGGVALTLPVWDRARGERAAAAARLRRAELERAALAAAAARQVVDAFDAYTRAREAVELLDRDVVPVLADSELLLERTIEAGQIAVHDYLVARQEILSGRREHLERQLELANAAALVRFVAGVAP